MDRLLKQQDDAEATLAFLKRQLQILNQLAAAKQKEAEVIEIQKLNNDNNMLQADIVNLKQELRFYEAQNGVKHVPVPKRVQTIGETSAPAVTGALNQAPDPAKEEKKEKKANKKEKKVDGKSGGKGAATDVKPVDVSRLCLKVGKIVDVKKHPDADTLYIETVELAEERPRTIISGIVRHVTLEQMQDRMAVFMCNLKPVKMRGVLSEGMIMCASTPEKVEVLECPKDAVPGDRVYCQGYTGEADTQLNPKKKIWEQVAPDMCVDSLGKPGYKGAVMNIPGKGECVAPTMKNCQIK